MYGKAKIKTSLQIYKTLTILSFLSLSTGIVWVSYLYYFVGPASSRGTDNPFLPILLVCGVIGIFAFAPRWMYYSMMRRNM